jgi:ATP-dependent protease ClpP protease subunit
MTNTRTRTTPPRHGAHVRASSGVTELWIYDEIGVWGVGAQAFVNDLKAAAGGPVHLHLNSPGGEVFDGIAIYEAIRSHPAPVTVYVEGLAASAASMIAMAGTEVVMTSTSMFMLHDALTMTYGNEAEHLASAALLGKVSDQLAAIYAARAGGTAAAWREVMRTEVWYSASEAVAAGLADRVADAPAVAAQARRDRATAEALAHYPSEAVGPRLREGFRAALGSANGVPLARVGAPARRPAGRRPVPSAMATLRALRAARR